MNEELRIKFQESYDKLNPAQKDAVDTIDGPVMLVAGPGSGKTQTIAMRIANILLKTQINPDNILCLTFTDSAVNTMRERLLKIIGTTAYDIRIYTFHSFCNEVIQTHPNKFGNLGAKIEPLTDIDKLKIIQGIIEELPYNSVLKPFGNTQTYVKDIEVLISGFKKDNISIETIERAINLNVDFYEKTKDKFQELKSLHYTKLNESVFTKFFIEIQNLGYSDFAFVRHLIDLQKGSEERNYTKLRTEIHDLFKKSFSTNITSKQIEFIKIFANYERALKDNGKYDYDDMIKSVVAEFSNDPELLSEYQEKYQYILVDEFQDTNNSQNEVLKLLGSFWTDPNIFVVGDDDQSIFRFQGASVENMASFYNTYISKIKIVTLTENYRSHQLILDAARGVIKYNGLQIDEILPNINKKLHSANPENLPIQKIDVKEYVDTQHEQVDIANAIYSLLDRGIKGNQIAIIHRNNADILGLLPILRAKGIKYRLEKGENILNDFEINKLLNFLRYLIEPDDENNLFVILNYDFLDLPRLDLSHFFTYATQNRMPFSKLIGSLEDLQKAGLEHPEKFTGFFDNLLKWRQEIYNIDGQFFFNKLLTETGYITTLAKKETYIMSISKLSRLYEEFKNLAGTKENYTIIEFIKDLSIYKEQNIELNDKIWGIDGEDAVKVMTAHGAKGQEFLYVFIIKCQSRNWGLKRNQGKIKPPFGLLKNQTISNELDEERRLFYVALTRAKQLATISYSKYNEKQKLENPSQFIKEIPAEFVNFEAMKNDDYEKAENFIALVKTQTHHDFTAESKSLVQNMLKDWNLNVTHINSYRKCPRCFFFNNVLKVPGLKTKSAALGSAIHFALKSLIDNFTRTGKFEELEKIQEDFARALRYEKLNEVEFIDSLNFGQKLITDFYQNKINTIPAKTFAEYNFKNSKIVYEGIPITGKIDRIDGFENNLLRVIDYKTGNPDNAGSKLSEANMGDYFLQLVFYKILVENSKIMKGSVTEGVIEFLQRNSKDEYTERKFILTSEHVAKATELIKETYAKIMELDFTRINTDTYNNACSNPDFHDLPWPY